VADSYFGKVKTIIYFSLVYMLGLFILFVTSLPIAIENGYAFGGLVIAMILIGLFVTYSSCRPSLLTFK
jgi:POT family proton-dependent oligopeptide transporter